MSSIPSGYVRWLRDSGFWISASEPRAADRHTQTVRPMSKVKTKKDKQKNKTSSGRWIIEQALYGRYGRESCTHIGWWWNKSSAQKCYRASPTVYHGRLSRCLSFDEILPPEGTTWNNLPNDLLPTSRLVMTLCELPSKMHCAMSGKGRPPKGLRAEALPLGTV